MERQEKGGSTYFFLALVTLAFLAAVLYLTFGANRTEQEGYTVQTERPAREEVAPERVLGKHQHRDRRGAGDRYRHRARCWRRRSSTTAPSTETFRRSTSCWRCAASQREARRHAR